MMSEKQLPILLQGRNYTRGNRQIIRIPRAFACISAGAPWLWQGVMQIYKVSQEPARLRMLTAPFHGTFFPLEVYSVRCSWSIACRRCSNYIFIICLTPGCNGLDKDNCKMRRETLSFCDLIRLILEDLRYALKFYGGTFRWCEAVVWCKTSEDKCLSVRDIGILRSMIYLYTMKRASYKSSNISFLIIFEMTK